MNTTTNSKATETVHIVFNGSGVIRWTADEALAIALCRTYRACRSECAREHVTAREGMWAEIK